MGRKTTRSCKTEGSLELAQSDTDVEGPTGCLARASHMIAKHEMVVIIGCLSVAMTMVTAKWDLIKFVILAVVVFEASWMLQDHLHRFQFVDETLAGFILRLSKLSSAGAILYGFLRCLGIISDGTSPQIIAALSIAIGLATQSVMGNLASGAMIVIFRPFVVGDVVSVNGNTFTITKIGVMFTYADDSNNHRVLLPNSKILDAQLITNWSRNTFRICNLTVKLRTGRHTCREIREGLETAATAIDLGFGEVVGERHFSDSLERPRTTVSGPLEFTSEGMVWKVKLYCLSSLFAEAEQHGNMHIHDHLYKAGISIFEWSTGKGGDGVP